MELIKAPNEFLEKQVAPFNFDTMDADKISKEMIEMMLKYKGVGLASNQVGIDAQIFVMGEENPITVINPMVTEVGTEKIEMEEGCLSFPNIFVKVTRPKEILAKWYDENLKEVSTKISGYSAKCILHEWDHLQGITFKDRVSKLKWDMAKKKAKKLERNNGI